MDTFSTLLRRDRWPALMRIESAKAMAQPLQDLANKRVSHAADDPPESAPPAGCTRTGRPDPETVRASSPSRRIISGKVNHHPFALASFFSKLLGHSPLVRDYLKPRHARGFSLLPPPALGERRHRGLARQLVAVHRAADVAVVAACSHPGAALAARLHRGRRCGQPRAIFEHVIIIVVAPLAGRARESPERFEYEPAHSALRRILRHHIEFDEVRKVERRKLRPIGMVLAVRFKVGHAALHDRRYKLAE